MISENLISTLINSFVDVLMIGDIGEENDFLVSYYDKEDHLYKVAKVNYYEDKNGKELECEIYYEFDDVFYANNYIEEFSNSYLVLKEDIDLD